MSAHTLAANWSTDGPLGVAFGVLVLAASVVYVEASRLGTRRDRRRRPWPRGRTFCFLAGMTVLVIDLYSGIATQADERLSVHMLEHTIIWVIVAPLIAASAPVRLAFFALRPPQRRSLASWIRSPLVSSFTSPVGSVWLVIGVIVISHVPSVYGLALRSDYVHETEHGLYLITALLVWARLLGVDPLPHPPRGRGQLAFMGACMMPMVLVGLWLDTASRPVYGKYLQALGPVALHDQRLAATVMWVGCLLACAVHALVRVRVPQRRVAKRLQSERVLA